MDEYGQDIPTVYPAFNALNRKAMFFWDTADGAGGMLLCFGHAHHVGSALPERKGIVVSAFGHTGHFRA